MIVTPDERGCWTAPAHSVDLPVDHYNVFRPAAGRLITENVRTGADISATPSRRRTLHHPKLPASNKSGTQILRSRLRRRNRAGLRACKWRGGWTMACAVAT